MADPQKVKRHKLVWCQDAPAFREALRAFLAKGALVVPGTFVVPHYGASYLGHSVVIETEEEV